jgi:hypothetical protein
MEAINYLTAATSISPALVFWANFFLYVFLPTAFMVLLFGARIWLLSVGLIAFALEYYFKPQRTATRRPRVSQSIATVQALTTSVPTKLSTDQAIYIMVQPRPAAAQ